MGGSFKQAIIELAKDKGIDIDENNLDIEWPDLSAVSPWISVEDELPDDVFDFVIAYADGAMSTIGYSSNSGFYEVHPIKTQLVIDDITHWMPLPGPPK